MTDLISDEAVCRTAPATLGMSIIQVYVVYQITVAAGLLGHPRQPFLVMHGWFKNKP